MIDPREHWNEVYQTKPEDSVSWFQDKPDRSLALIRQAAPDRSSPVIDVGGGASRLADELVREGYGDVTVLDISQAALAKSQARLGQLAACIHWIATDITAWVPDRTWKVWHDRAVFHFLTDEASQDRYLTALEQATEPGAAIIIATFALDGPERCSGLAVQRYSAELLVARLGKRFEPVRSEAEVHITPKGSKQSFVYGVFRRR